jgi:hypothetical protein
LMEWCVRNLKKCSVRPPQIEFYGKIGVECPLNKERPHEKLDF